MQSQADCAVQSGQLFKLGLVIPLPPLSPSPLFFKSAGSGGGAGRQHFTSKAVYDMSHVILRGTGMRDEKFHKTATEI